MTSTSAQALRIVSANIEEGGLDADGSRARRERTVEAVGTWSPDPVCVQPQRLRCRATAIDHGGLHGHLRRAQAGGDALAGGTGGRMVHR